MPIFKKKFRGSSYRQEIEVEDIFLDKILKEKTDSMEIWERRLEVPLKKRMFVLLLGLVIAVTSVLLYSSFVLQALSYEKFKLMSDDNKFRFAHFSASRGIIYDRNLEPLVTNEASFDVWANKSEVSSDEAKLAQLAQIINLSIEEIKKTLQVAGPNEVLIKKNLNHQELVLLEAKLNEFPGLKINKGILRIYSQNKALGPILGFLGKIAPKELTKFPAYDPTDQIGKEGLEKFYEDILKERKGQFQIERNAKGEEISKQITEYPKSGNGLVLSLDTELQSKVLQYLQDIMVEVGSKKASAVALDPRNGEVLAMVSLPSFDNNLFASGISAEDFRALDENPLNPQLNRAIAGLYPSGSTLKPFIATAALEEKVVTENTKLWCPLKICLENIYNPDQAECFVDNKFHGTSDVKRALAESVNPFFYLVGGGYTAPKSSSKFFDQQLPRNLKGLGVSKIDQYLSLFGFGSTTGIDLPGEAAGRVPTPEWKQKYFKTSEEKVWHLGDTYNLAIGQGYLLVTPLQMATAIAAVANDGKLIKPRLAKQILDPFGQPLQDTSPEIIRQNFVSQNNLAIVRAGMRQAVTSPNGSCFNQLNRLPVRVAAKTGTAQISKKEIYENWIAAFAPYDKPEIVIVVLIEEVPGMKVAAQRVVRNIISWYFAPEQPEPTDVIATSTATTSNTGGTEE